MSKDNVVFYSCIVNGRDKPKIIEFKENFRYVLFSDKKYSSPDWEVLPIVKNFDDPVRTARFHKHNPFLLFPNCEYAIWLDGSHWPISSISSFLKNDFCLMRHFSRTSVFQEVEECRRLRIDVDTIMKNQYDSYIQDGFLDTIGLYDTCFMIRKNTNKIVNMQKMWWDQICQWSKRDQISLPYVLWKCNIEPFIVPGHTRFKGNSYFRMISHNKKFRKIM